MLTAEQREGRREEEGEGRERQREEAGRKRQLRGTETGEAKERGRARAHRCRSVVRTEGCAESHSEERLERPPATRAANHAAARTTEKEELPQQLLEPRPRCIPPKGAGEILPIPLNL